MSKTVCTVSIFITFLAAIVAMCVVHIHVPWLGKEPIPIIFPLCLVAGWLFVAAAVLYGLWHGAEKVCSALRRRFLTEREPADAPWEIRISKPSGEKRDVYFLTSSDTPKPVDPEERAKLLRELSDEAAADLPTLTLKQIHDALASPYLPKSQN